MRPRLSLIFFVLFTTILCCVRVSAQDSNTGLQVTENVSDQVTRLNDEVSMLRTQLNNQLQKDNSQATRYGSTGLLLFLCGAFCALWAQDSGRRPWFWFVVGFLFPLLTVIALLVKNSDDIRREK